MNTGHLCMKIAGRDAGQLCVIVKTLDQNHVLIDGNTRRKKCNVKHLELLDKVLSIDEDASHDAVVKAMRAAGLKVAERKTRTKKTIKRERQKRTHKTKQKPAADLEKKTAKPKKTVPKPEKTAPKTEKTPQKTEKQ